MSTFKFKQILGACLIGFLAYVILICCAEFACGILNKARKNQLKESDAQRKLLSIQLDDEKSKSQSVSYSYDNKLELSQLEINKKKVLGKGSFGKVYFGKYFKSPVAIKKLKLKEPSITDTASSILGLFNIDKLEKISGKDLFKNEAK